MSMSGFMQRFTATANQNASWVTFSWEQRGTTDCSENEPEANASSASLSVCLVVFLVRLTCAAIDPPPHS